MVIVDFHSHFLPAIDDGSQNPETSQAMLKETANQDVDYIVATPHFYADEERIEVFLDKRKRAYESIELIEEEKTPQILLGAEVAYFPGISSSEHINKLFIEGTNLLLLEMPFNIWTASALNEVKKLIYDNNIRIILAHLERYIYIPENKKYLNELIDLPVILQFNAKSLNKRKTRNVMLKAMKGGCNCVLGSDCHDMKKRMPDLKTGRNFIAKKLGCAMLNRIDKFGELILFGENKEKICLEK